MCELTYERSAPVTAVTRMSFTVQPVARRRGSSISSGSGGVHPTRLLRTSRPRSGERLSGGMIVSLPRVTACEPSSARPVVSNSRKALIKKSPNACGGSGCIIRGTP